MPVRVGGTAAEIENTLRQLAVDLSADEALRIKSLLGRDPTACELHIFDIMWSEHCSYKSSKRLLQQYLPIEGERVVLGPGEDAGVVRLAPVDDTWYVLVVAHESHNHPSQILPVEGAATGIGGIVRDVYCMGADVVGVMDALRFGDPAGPRSESVKEIVAGVVTGIWEYANALGVPNAGGDVFFDRGYDENCLVNVIAFGVARENEIIRSRVPKEAQDQPYDIIIVGKPTDRSGLGGATMASKILDADGQAGVGAVQLHDPFLKRVLTVAQRALLKEIREADIKIGYKDLGAGGIACAVSEIVGSGGFGADIDLDRVHVALESIEPFAIACSETQERYCLAVPSTITPRILEIYNDEYQLPHIYKGARASVVGRVTAKRDLVMRSGGQVVVNLPVEIVNQGISYAREAKSRPAAPDISAGPLSDLEGACIAVLELLSVASKQYVYRHYDSEVKGLSVLKPGEADACVTAIAGTPLGIATSVDGNPRYSLIDPYAGAALAVCESIRNVASVGAIPVALTDCLNFGDPEDPYVFHDFAEAVRGIGDAARALKPYGSEEAIPVVSGNVSFYNESQGGAAIPPSPIVACYGLLDDYSLAVTMGFKQAGSDIVMIGTNPGGLGGSALYAAIGLGAGGRLPPVDLERDMRTIHAVTEIVRGGHVLACHDISEGGLFSSVAEMITGGWGLGSIGAEITIDGSGGLTMEEGLFCEFGGFLLETRPGHTGEVMAICRRLGVQAGVIGRTSAAHDLTICADGKILVKFSGDRLRRSWMEAVQRAVI